MGFTLPRKYGGLNCPNLIYTMATEIGRAGRRLVHEHVRPAGDRRDRQRLRQPGDQGRSAAPVLDRRSDRRHGADRARRGERPAGRPPAGTSGRAGQLVPERRQAVHHQRLRRDPADPGPQRAGDQRRARAEPVHLRAVGADQGPAPGEEAGHPRLADLRAGVRQRARPAGRRAAAGPDHLRAGPDERGPRGDRRPVAGDRRSGLPAGSHLRPHAAPVRPGDRGDPARGRDGHRHAEWRSRRPGP